MKTAIQNARIFDGDETVIEKGTVLFDETGILEVSRQALPGDTVIDGTGKTVTPGLIDCHIHLGFGLPDDNCGPLQAAALAARQVDELRRFGITTARNCGTPDDVDLYIRNLIRQGAITGVRLLACGRGISITGGHGWRFSHECDTPEEARKAARVQLRQQADHVKVFATGGMGTKGSIPNAPQLTEAQMRVVAEEAAMVGAFTTAHCTGLEGAQRAIRAGIRSIEHAQLDEETAQMMKEYGAFYCPTIITRYNIIHCTLPEFMWMKAKSNPGDLERKERALRLCKQYDIPICAGTDSGFGVLVPLGASLADELRIYTEYGLTNMEALRTATKNASILLQLDHLIGTLEPGKAADLAVFEGNPLEIIGDLKKVSTTFQGGILSYCSTVA